MDKVVVSVCLASDMKKRREVGFSKEIKFFLFLEVAVPTWASEGASRRPLAAGGRHFIFKEPFQGWPAML